MNKYSNVSAHKAPAISSLLIRINAALTMFANKLPSQRKVFKDFFKKAALATVDINLDEVYHYAYDTDLFVSSIAVSKLVSTKSRVNMSDEQKQLIRELSAIKRGLKFDLLKLKRTASVYVRDGIC